MTKKRALLLICFSAVFLFAAFAAQTGSYAYADDVDLHAIDRVVIDLAAVNEEGEALELAPTEGGAYELTYGSVLTLRARLDDADTENAPSLYDDVYMYYQWFFSDGTSESTPLSERIVGETNVRLTLTEHMQSGVYFIRLTNIQYGGSRLAFEEQSEPFDIKILPKKLTVEYTTTEVVYNGKAQDIGYTVTGEVAGRPANCLVEYDRSPTNVGTYNAFVFTQNDNYLIEREDVEFVITKAPLTVTAGSVVVLAGYSYEVSITYEGFCGSDNENSLDYPPTILGADLAYREPGFYQVIPDGPATDKNYEITYVAGTVQVNRSTLKDDSVLGFTGTAKGSFSSDAALSITEVDKEVVKSAFKLWQVPSTAYELKLTGSSNQETYTVVMENVELAGWVKNICFVNEEGKTEKVSSFSYDKDQKRLTLVMTQTSGYVVAYHNYLWYVIAGAVLLLIIISLLIFHSHDRNKHKLNRLIAGSAKVEADYYREKIGAYEEKERRKI